jgi:hypothetical protein
MRRFSIAFLTAGFVISVLGASPGAVMAAAPTSSPTLISPSDGATVSSNPVFNWTAVTGASKYRIEVSTSNTFNPIVWHVDTVALHATPPTQLPTGALWWHVAGMDASLNVGPYAVDSFTRVQSTAPVPVGPTDGQTLHFPTDPTLFTWQPVAGATSYTIQISTTSIFTTATSYTTKNSSFALTDIQAFTQNDGVTPQSWYWRVQATLATSQSTEWSTPRSYQIDWSAKPTLETPVDGAIGVTEVVFSWDPVLGAAAYDIQYSPNPDFQNNTVNMVVDGTRYAPYPTLSNQAYYWHVRARAPGSNPNTGQWSDTHTFTREWSTQPLTVSPHWIVGSPDIPIVSNFEVAWTPAAASGAGWVDHASDYEVEISTAATFGTYYDCFTNHTTFSLYGAESGLTPSSGSYAEPGVCTFSSPTSSSPIPLTSGLTYYWRVRPVDLPNGLHGRWDLQAESNTPQRFIWDPTQPVPCGPLDGATVSTPALCWTHSSDADYYHVTINKHNGTLALEADTYATTYTPTVALNPADGPFSWHVEGTDGAVWTPQWLTPPTFNLAAPTTAASLDLLSPSTGTAGVLPPSLVWQPYTGASYYEVFYGTAPSTWNVTPLSGAAKLPYAAFTYGDRSSVLAGGSYYWEVKAFTAGDVLMATSDARTFKIGYDGDDLDWIMPWSSYLTPQCTTKTDPTGPSGRCVPTLGDTQRMSWIPDAQAQVYEVWVAKDIYFTNVYRRYRTTMTSITPRESFLDSTAGQSYYWFVQPCLDWNHLICGPDPTTVAGFNNAAAYKKNSAPVTGLTTLQAPTEPSPICIDANPCQIPDQITFSWNDYMTESQAAAYPDPVAGYNSTRVSQEAKEYEITVATSADFNAGSLIESKTKVDTNSYTPYSKTYPEGALWWRVQAVDGSGNELTASVTASVTKASPKITLTSPAASAVVSGVPYFRWTPQNWAAKYTIEIYKNGDTLFSPSNLFAGTGNTPTSIAAWVPTIAMPAGTYAWRVARVDVGGKAGPWSTGRVFTLQPAAPTLTAPADLATVNGSDMLFSWTGPANAVSYKIQTSASASFGTTIESQTTVMSSWSPTRLYTNGTYYWQVSILDSANNVLRTSGYRTFFVGTVPAPPATPSTYHAISPVRVLDTRSQTGLSAKLQANNAATFQVTGRGDVSPQIPTGATAVTGNVTVVNSNNGWAVYLGPSPIDKPTTSTINFIAGQVAGNGLTVALSATGTLSATFISSAGATTDLVFDVTGYFTPDMTGATYHPIDPVRELDTRSHNGLNQHLSANIPQTFTVAGRNGIPSSAVAVTGNVTVVNPTNAWAVYLGPASTSSPTTSTINFSANQVAGNNLTVALGGGGTLSATYMSTSGNTTDLVFDVTGYYTADATGVRFVPMSPARILDTRSNVGITGKIPANTPKSFLARAGGVPSSATGVTGNVTVVNETSGWAVFLGPTSNSAPTTSTINFVVGDVKGNGLTVALSASGTLYATYISTAGNKTDLVFDVTGYFVK